jgi:hypothetical protein
MRFDRKYLLFFLVLPVLMGCSTQPAIPGNKMPDLDVSPNNINHQLQIYTQGKLPLKYGYALDVILRVNGDEPIAFNRDYGISLYVYENESWSEIENYVDLGVDAVQTHVISPFHGNVLNELDTIIQPRFPQHDKPTWIRIISVGNLTRDGKIINEKVAGYVDIQVVP